MCEKLNPCPCGGMEIQEDDVGCLVVCYNCEVRTLDEHSTRQAAINNWNLLFDVNKIKAGAVRECSEQSFIDDKFIYMSMQNRADKIERGEV